MCVKKIVSLVTIITGFVFYGFFLSAQAQGGKAEILDIPLPNNIKCFDSKYARLRSCKKFYENGPWGLQLKCPKVYDPVYDKNGRLYPSPCFAGLYGIKQFTKGVSPEMRRFVSDLWGMPKDPDFAPSVANFRVTESPTGLNVPLDFDVPVPNVEFLYDGNGRSIRSGDEFVPTIRSSVFPSQTSTIYLDIHVGEQFRSTSLFPMVQMLPLSGKKIRVLLVYVQLDQLFPEKFLKTHTKKTMDALNLFFRKKQEHDKPTQYSTVAAVSIPPPKDADISELRRMIMDREDLKIVRDAQKKVGKKSFDMLVTILVAKDGSISGPDTYGEYCPDPVSDICKATVNLAFTAEKPYEESNFMERIRMFNSFVSSFTAGSHEIFHSTSWDHFPDSDLQDELLKSETQDPPIMDLLESYSSHRFSCSQLGFLYQKTEVLPIELPKELKIIVGKEPSYTFVEKDSSGNCLYADGFFLKDLDQDGDYDSVMSFQNINPSAQRTVGWKDVDGDGIAEIVDPHPFGGIKEKDIPKLKSQGSVNMSSFTSLGQVQAGKCLFEKVELNSGDQGLVPIECPEFEPYISNLYRGMKYNWKKMKSRYGILWIPTLILSPAFTP